MDTSVENVMIEPPQIDEDNENMYIFNLSTPDGEPLVFESNSLYSINGENEDQMLTIPSKDDLRVFSTIYNSLKGAFLEKHEEWFEQKFTSSVLDDLFKNFLQPNIVENCIDLKISISREVLDKINSSLKEDEKSCQVVPVFLFDSIVLNVENNKMGCKVILHDFQLPASPTVEESEQDPEPVVEEKEPEPAPVVEESEQDPEPVVEEKESEPAPVVEEKEQEPVVEEKEPEPAPVVEEPESEPKQDENELVELDFDTTNLDESEIKVNVEDYLIIYKYILGQIKENKIREIEKICEKKNIEMEILDYEEIFDNSEDEYLSSDTESEISDDETSLN